MIGNRKVVRIQLPVLFKLVPALTSARCEETRLLQELQPRALTNHIGEVLSLRIVAQEQPKTSRSPYMSQLPSTRHKTRSIATICAGLLPCLLRFKVARHSRVDLLG